ncbi:DDB1- and CUL4-associated factor 13-like [Haliotis cracherodii]|uniref:DDB1- and CUL4-associated factor 13-like n=1 Tax=Haliotis cracherodii TaxID=6455 RepID=UPI0039E8AA01
MRVKLLSRNPDDYLRETKRDIHRVPRNYDPSLHPFETGREYVRAVNATKLERVFAKPFLGSLDGHRDGVTQLCKHPSSISTLLSGSCDGEVRVWNLAKRDCATTIQAHEGFVHGLDCHHSQPYFFTCGADSTIKQWQMTAEGGVEEEPLNIILGKTMFQCLDHHWSENIFATSGDQVDIWDESRSKPIRTFNWGIDSIKHVKFNPVETHLLGATGMDRSVLLYDMRGSSPLRKVILKMCSNAISWNPMEAFTFTVANEDCNLYTFDMRKLSMPLNFHMDHISAVMDVDYSPTGREFVSAGYDKCVRIFPVDQRHSREIYHAKRMQRVGVVRWSLDNKYILSASDEMNIRVWKANASEKLGVLKPREKTAFNYNEKLKEKFGHHPQVRRISRHRHVPQFVYNGAKEIKLIRASHRRKESNRRAHSKPGAIPEVKEKEKHVVGEVE